MGSNKQGDDANIAVVVSGLTTDPVTALPVVLLTDLVGNTTIPVSIGLSEASALAAEIDRIELARPASHQLTAAMLETCGARVVRIVITDVEGSLFSAVLHLELATGGLAVHQARPSDAIALALRSGAEIEVTARVIDKVAQFDLAACWERGLPAPESSLERYDDELLATLGDDAFGKWKM